MTKEMEALADRICKEELGQEPNETNLAFRKTLVHGMVRWDEEIKAKNLSSNTVVCTCMALHRSDECYKLGCKVHRNKNMLL